MTVIDAHQHFWNVDSHHYGWLQNHAVAKLNRNYLPEHVNEALTEVGVDGTILVQADDSDADTDFMLDLANRSEQIVGVVGWVPLVDRERTEERLTELLRNPKFVGIRHLMHDEPDPDWVVREDVIASLELLASRGVPFEVVAVLPRHLEHVATLARRVPGLTIIIDHLAKPPISARGWEPWADLMMGAAAYPRVYSKLSGLTTAASSDDWGANAMQRYVCHALDVFGPERIMVGSDWPVSALTADFATVWHEQVATLASLSDTDRGQVLGGTATEVYGLVLSHARTALSFTDERKST